MKKHEIKKVVKILNLNEDEYFIDAPADKDSISGHVLKVNNSALIMDIKMDKVKRNVNETMCFSFCFGELHIY